MDQLPLLLTQRVRDRETFLRTSDDPAFHWHQGWEVAEIPDDTTAEAFVTRHHYSRAYPAARFRFGLYLGGELQGVAVYSHPVNNATLTSVFPGDPLASTELGRLILLPEVPFGGESAFVAETFRRLRRDGLAGVVSFSDPCPRTDVAGKVTLPGHWGIVYQALSARWVGKSKPDVLRLLPDGTTFSRRALSKVRDMETGWEKAVARLQAAGAGPLDRDPRAWVAEWLPRVTRPLRHPGCIKYAWGLHRSTRLEPNPREYPVPPLGRVLPRFGRRALALAA